MDYHSKDLEDKVNEYDWKINDVANDEDMQHNAASNRDEREVI